MGQGAEGFVMRKLRRGDRVRKVGPAGERCGQAGTVVGIGVQSAAEGRECYWVHWDEHGPQTRGLYHVDNLAPIDDADDALNPNT